MTRLIPILALALPLAGCLERDEVIVVHRDGSADVTLTCAGDAGDFNETLVLPAGWKVAKERRGDRTVWTATASLRDLNDHPKSDPQFPYETTLRVTVNGAVRTWDFERTYPQMDARDVLAVDQALWRREEAKALLARLHDRGIAGLTEAERGRLFELGAEAEREKQTAVAARALRLHAEASGLAWRDRLAALARIEELYRAQLTRAALEEALGARLEHPERYDGLARRLRARAAERVPGLGPSLEKAAAAVRAAQAVSDDTFKLTVRLPGAVAAGNAHRVDGGTATWEFPGRDLGAGPVVLRATSVEAVR